MIGITERSKKWGEFNDNKPLEGQNYTSSEISANSKRTRAEQHRDDVRAQQRLKKWRLIAAVIDWRRCLKKNREEVKRRIRHGVPDWFRFNVWQLISDGREIPSENPAVDYAQLISYEMSEFEKLRIVKDISRTLKSLALSKPTAGVCTMF